VLSTSPPNDWDWLRPSLFAPGYAADRAPPRMSEVTTLLPAA
jgi:hypothetical protein